MVFCKIIRKIVGTAAPVDKELAFMDSVFDPVEAHVDCLGAALLDSIVGDACGAGIVSLKWGCRLRMAHLFEGCAEPGAIFGVVEGGAEFCFGGGRHDSFDDGAEDVYCSIERWRGCSGIRCSSGVSRTIAEKENAAGA